jgi:hypothetical protein
MNEDFGQPFTGAQGAQWLQLWQQLARGWMTYMTTVMPGAWGGATPFGPAGFGGPWATAPFAAPPSAPGGTGFTIHLSLDSARSVQLEVECQDLPAYQACAARLVRETGNDVLELRRTARGTWEIALTDAHPSGVYRGAVVSDEKRLLGAATVTVGSRA